MLAWERRRAVRTQPLRTESWRGKCERACVIYDWTFCHDVSLMFFRAECRFRASGFVIQLQHANTQRRKPMKRHLLVMATVVLAAAAVHAAGPKSEASAGPAAYARLKTLVGEWEADTGMGKVHVSYEL